MLDHLLVHFEIPADDVERARKFYKDLFGWQLEAYEPSVPDYLMLDTQAKPDAAGIALYRRSEGTSQPVAYFGVSSVEDAERKVQELGGKILMPRQDAGGFGWFAVCQDTENNVFGLYQRNPAAQR